MSELSPNEKAFLDEAFERLRTTRRTFTEKEALQPARLEGYELKLSFDERFDRAEGRQGNIPPHWRLTEQVLANTRLLNELQAGTWDGQDLDQKLLQLEQEHQQHYTFYIHDPRLFQSRQGAWEASGERQITLPLGLKEELDTFKASLHARWSELQTPLTVGQILTILEELGWQHEHIASVHRCLRAWLLTSEQFRRVGPDYWLPIEQLPAEVQHTRLQVLPIRSSSEQSLPEPESLTTLAATEQARQQRGEQIVLKGTATKVHVAWTTTLRSIQQLAGFIPIPRAIRGIYPPIAPGEKNSSVFKGLWYDDASELWIWLDRTHHRLYGPDLLNTIGLFPAGIKLRIEWNTEQIILREAGYDPEVQREETRLLDPEALKALRNGLGESYRQAIQTLLLAHPEGMRFKAIVVTLRQQQQHEVTRPAISTALSSGGFILHEAHWFAAPDNQLAARQLRQALLATLIPQGAGERAPLSRHDHVRTQVKAIHHRLQEIASMLRENRES